MSRPVAHVPFWHSLSWVLTGGQAVWSALHAFPHLVYPARPQTTAVVAFIQTLGPVWLLLFGVSALALVVALVRGRAQHWAHLGGFAVWVFYSLGLWVGVIATRGVWTLAVVATLFAAVHLVAGTAYATGWRSARPEVGR